VYGASEGLHTLLIEREATGGQAGTSSRIENYLGFPTGLSGDDLGSRALEQAKRLGAEVLVTRFVLAIDPLAKTVTLDGEETLVARTLVLATGVTWRAFTIEGIDRLTGVGVYYGAARSEARNTIGKDVYLIGGGNSAGQAAMFFANYARSVTILIRGASLAASMSDYLIKQLATKDSPRLWVRGAWRSRSRISTSRQSMLRPWHNRHDAVEATLRSRRPNRSILATPHALSACKTGSSVRPSGESRYSTFGGTCA